MIMAHFNTYELKCVDIDNSSARTLVDDGAAEADNVLDGNRIHAVELPEYVSILEDDDVTQFRSMPNNRLHLYVHGRFDYTTSKIAADLQDTGELFEIPFNLAVGYQAIEIVKDYLVNGYDLTRLDTKSANVLHILVYCASGKLRPEDKYVEICQILLDELSENQFRALCIQENTDGLRPLELAAKLGTFGLFRELILHPGYICGHPRFKGWTSVHSYDVTEYEPGFNHHRFIRSPLQFMIYVSNDGMESMKKYGITELPVVKKWIRWKIRQNFPFLILWWILRLAYIYSITFVDPTIVVNEHMCHTFNWTEHVDRSDEHEVMRSVQCNKMKHFGTLNRRHIRIVMICIQMWSFLLILLDILELVVKSLDKDRRRAYSGLFRYDFASYTVSYRFSQFILVFLTAVAPFLARLWPGGRSVSALLIIKTLQLPLCLMSFLYVVEFLPMLGIFAITLQRMLGSMVVFFIFLAPVKIIFSRFFVFFSSRDDDKLEPFQDFSRGIYILFLMDMGSYSFGSNPSLLVKLVHIFYFMVMVVLLLNYLIAVLSLVADEVAQHRKLHLILRRLQMISLIEERVGFLFWKLVYKFRTRQSIIVYAPSAPITSGH